VLSGAIKVGGQMAKKTTQAVHVRMPKDLHRKIQREADRHGQTINAEILVRLEQSFDIRERLDAINATIQESLERDAAFSQSTKQMAQAYQKLAEEAATSLRHEWAKAFRGQLDKELEEQLEWLAHAQTERPSDARLQRMKDHAERLRDRLSKLGTSND
jgi:aminopeptidase N